MSNLITDSNHEEFVVYRLLTANPVFYMAGYKTKEGNEMFYQEGTDVNGNPIRKRFTWQNKQLKVHKSQTAQIEFLDNSPFCEGSPNKRGKVYYKKIDYAGDAAKRVESQQDRINAEYTALNLDQYVVEMVAIMSGVTSPNPTVQKDAVIKFAAEKPRAFLDMVDEENLFRLEIKVFVRNAVRHNVISRQGDTYSWQGRPIGRGEDEVVDAMIEDTDLYTYCREAYDKLSSGATQIKKKKKSPSKK